MKRGQSAIEFVVLVSFMLVVFFGFFIIIQNRIIDITDEQDILFLKEANNIVLSEIDLAFAAAPDFQHTFIIPDRGASTFVTNITNEREVTSVYGDFEYVNFFLYNVTGYLNPLNKNNTIYSLDGVAIFPNGTQIINNDYSGVFVNVNPEMCFIADNLAQCDNTSLIPTVMLPACNSYFSLC